MHPPCGVLQAFPQLMFDTQVSGLWLMQAMSHAHDDWQSRLRLHEAAPVQEMLQAPSPHTMSRHEPAPEQAMVQALAFVQLMPARQLPWFLQSMLQFQPDGHVIGAPQFAAPVVPHSMLQVFDVVSHDEQPSGQEAVFGASACVPNASGWLFGASSTAPFGTTQKPSEHTRSAAIPMHSAFFVHA